MTTQLETIENKNTFALFSKAKEQALNYLRKYSEKNPNCRKDSDIAKIEALQTFPTLSRQLRGVDATAKAKLIKAQLAATYPNTKFGVHCDDWNSIIIEYKSGDYPFGAEFVKRIYSDYGATDSSIDFFDTDTYVNFRDRVCNEQYILENVEQLRNRLAKYESEKQQYPNYAADYDKHIEAIKSILGIGLIQIKEKTTQESDPLYDARKEHFEAKKERQLEGTQNAIQNREEKIEELNKKNKQIGEILNGQPILVGHHSEKRHRKEIDRIWARTGKVIELGKEVEKLETRAENLVNPKSISSDDPDAITKLEAKLASLIAEREEWKKVPIKPRTYDGSKTDARWYTIPNLSANIRTVKKRIEELKKLQTIQSQDKTINGVDLVIDKVENRVKLIFPGKPSAEIISKLKSHGFHWSKFNSAWQRQLNETAIYYAEEIIKEVKV